MEIEENLEIEIEVPFPSEKEAEIAYHVLRVDSEPKRSKTTKNLTYKSNKLIVTFSAPFARSLRVAVTSFYTNLALIVETFKFGGEPPSEPYSHF